MVRRQRTAFASPIVVSVKPSGRNVCARRLRMSLSQAAQVKLEKRNVHRVDPLTGSLLSKTNQSGEAVAECLLQLDAREVPELQLVIDRKASAVVYAREKDVDDAFSGKPPAAVFLHGFSQRPANYATLLRALAARGYVVVAPRVWLFDVAMARVEGAAPPGGRASQPAKLQTALLTDGLRCVTWVREAGLDAPALLGHSMGGAMALVAAHAARGSVSSVCSLMPAVGLEITRVNKMLSVSDADGDVAEFARTYGDVPMLLKGGGRDRIASLDDVQTVFEALAAAQKPGLLGLCSFRDGYHVGVQDSLNVDVPVLRILDTLFSRLLDLVVYGVFENVLDFDEQREYSIQLVSTWLDEIRAGSDAESVKKAIGDLDMDKKVVDLAWGK